MKIVTLTPDFYFSLFYLIAFAFVFIMVIVFSVKRGYHLQSVLLMITTISLLTIIGSRLFTIPFSEWNHIMGSDSIINYNNRSAIGALLFGIIGLLISQKLFGFGRPILDLYAWLVPVGLGIQKIGCFLNGCCYGKQSDILLGVNYPKGTHVHFDHFYSGLIDGNDAFSQSVHPVQLYETIGLFIIGYVAYKIHLIWKKKASALLFTLFVFFSFRFFIEFLRDPMSSQFNVNYFQGLRIFQWLILLIGLLLGTLLFIYEKYIRVDVIKSEQNTPFVRVDLLYIFMISVIIYSFNGLFTTFELSAIWMKFMPAIILTIYFVFKNNEVKKYRLVTSCLMLIPLFVMSQSIHKDSTKVEKYKRINVGGSFGGFSNEVLYNPRQGECGTSYSSETFEHVYKVGGVGYSQIIKKDNNITTYGVNLHGGTNKTTILSTNEDKTNFIYGVNPFIKYDMKWIGLGAGFQLGNIKKNINKTESSSVSDAQKTYTILPEFYVRLGRRDILDIDYNYGFLFPSAYPTLNQRISIGSGFGYKADYSLRYGYFLPLETQFISAEGLINERLGINMMYIFKEDNVFENHNPKGKLVFGLNYRFGFK